MKLLLDPQNFSFSGEKLLLNIHSFLQEQKIKLQDIKGIHIETPRQGVSTSFTALRTARVIANTLAYVLKIPVN